jgi:cysteinyl-tRNA synthetase
MAALFNLVAAGNAELDRRGRDAGALERARHAFDVLNGVLDVEPDALRVSADGAVARVIGAVGARGSAAAAPAGASGEPAVSGSEQDHGEEKGTVAWALERRAARAEARARRDFAAADALRGELEAAGWLVKDTPHGTALERYD